MTQISRLQVYTTMVRSGLVPVFYTDDADEANSFVTACADGGVKVFEFTNRGRGALPVFQQLRAAHPDKILGIGSVVDAPTAALFIANGADFVVGPSFNVEVVQLCNQRKVAYIPGCATITEIQTAEAHGAEIVKVFPASVYGPEFVKAVRAPMPWTRIMPTGGVGTSENDIRMWFGAGVSCVGVGSSLGKVDDIAATCRQLLAWIEQYRQDDGHAL